MQRPPRRQSACSETYSKRSSNNYHVGRKSRSKRSPGSTQQFDKLGSRQSMLRSKREQKRNRTEIAGKVTALLVSGQLIFTQIFRVCAESHKLRFRFGTAQSRRVLATSRFLLELHGLLPTHNRARTA